MSDTATAPLEGIRVLDLTRMLSGPYCTRLLADCGAEVIKVEPAGGEHMRDKEPLRKGASSYFGHFNAGKKSLALDLRSERVQQVLRELAGACDVVVENFRPGITRQMGLDYATLSQARPDLIYCSISGFGQTGPRAAFPAYAPVVHAASGHELAVLACQTGIDRPLNASVYYADMVAGAYAFGAIQTALLSRALHGGGQFIDVALMDTMLNLMVLEVQEAQFPPPYERYLFQPVRAADGYVIVVPVSRSNFERLTEAVGRPDWLTDPRFSARAERERNWDALMSEIESWTSQRTAQACEETLMAAGVPCSRYLTIEEAMQDPHMAERGVFRSVRDAGGAFQIPNPPFQFANGTVCVQPSVSPVGAHNREVLALVPSLGEDDIDELLAGHAGTARVPEVAQGRI